MERGESGRRPDQPCHLVAPLARSSSRAYRLACLARRTFADRTEGPDRPASGRGTAWSISTAITPPAGLLAASPGRAARAWSRPDSGRCLARGPRAGTSLVGLGSHVMELLERTSL